VSARRLHFGLATVLGLAKRGFFIPYRYADTLPPAGARPTYRAIEALFDAHRTDFLGLIDGLADYAEPFAAIGPDSPPAPRWNQDWFPRLDAAVAYAMVRRGAPARIVEVGSGHSTRFMARAVADGGLATRITAIDPAPRAALDGLDIEIHRKTVHQAGAAPFADLAAGDILFIDSSHILMPGSDVDWLFNHLLPTLPAGLRIHIHDVFLPDDYPVEWDWRAYNEQLAAAAMLLTGGYRPLFASGYAVTRLAGAVAASAVARLPLGAGAYETSLWLEKTCPAIGSRAVDGK
jgi:hypothetical protein